MVLANVELKRTPLFESHLKLNAKMVPFGGWEMPVQYDGIISEYQHTRQGVTIFDISHMGEFYIDGDSQESGLENIFTQNIKDIPIKMSRYGCMLNDKGGTLDDCIMFRLDKNKWFLVVNGATIEKDAAHIKQHLNKKATFRDATFDIGKIDIQGPQARDVLKKFVPDIEKLNYFHFDFFNLLGQNVLISRTGYTGELGYEIFYPWEKTKVLWDTFLDDKRVKPAGLGARDVLRLEMGYCLYGHELSETITPLEAGLSRFIDFEKDFIGKQALLKQKENGLKRKLVGLISENRRSPRQDHKIYLENGQEIGVITSGTFSPALNLGIGVGFVDHNIEKGAMVIFGDEKSKTAAKISGKIFYTKGSLKN